MSEGGIPSETPARLRGSSWSVELLGGCGANRLRGWGQDSLCAPPRLNPGEAPSQSALEGALLTPSGTFDHQSDVQLGVLFHSLAEHCARVGQ